MTEWERPESALPSDGKIALALSGGRDSVALAHVLLRAGADFFAVHVEHGIRGESSLRDADFVRSFCKERGIPLEVFSVDVPTYAREKGLTTEQAARELRYGVFDGLLAEGKCRYVALAHHADDQTETVLMRIFRGTGIKGLRGMAERSGSYIRPLLGISREEINEYVAENGLPYVEDETNADPTYTRNFLRREIAVLKEKYPALNEAVARLARHAAEADDFIEAATPVPVMKEGEAHLGVDSLKEPVTAKRAVCNACAAVGVRQDIEERHYALVFRLAESESGKRLELPHGLTVYKQGGELVFAKSRFSDGDESTTELDEGIPFPRGEFAEAAGLTIRRVSPDKADFDADALYIDGDKVPADAVLRHRREGDVIEKFGGGTKSLGDFFTDRKIPLRHRDDIVVCASGREVLFAAGVEISEKVRIDKDTKNIIKITEDKDVR